jgi:pimeloyl-ACP methyl ester carboxylesterase
VTLVVLLVAIPLLGIVYQRSAEASDRNAYPPPGQMVDVGGFSLHIHCMGNGSPTVILEAGTGESSLDWLLVQPGIAASTRVCAYDRQGYGWSEDGKHSRTSQQVAADLHTLLINASIEPPYVLVGHSVGAYHSQAYIDQYPDEVVGVVLVDPPGTEYFTNSGQSDEEVSAYSIGVEAKGFRILRFLSTVGVVRLTNLVATIDPVINGIPTDEQPAYSASLNQTRYFVSLQEEWETYAANMRYADALPPLSSDLPVVILTRDWSIANYPSASTDQEDQIAYAARWHGAHVVVADGSDHFITVRRPELVIQSVHNVLEAARTGELLVQ